MDLNTQALNLDPLAADVAQRAKALYDSKRMLCSEAVLVALHEAFDGPLTLDQAQAVGLAHGFAFGGSGCLCGAVNGAITGASLLLAGHLPPFKIRKAARELHDSLHSLFGSSCCRVLSKKVSHDKALHMEHCSNLTKQAALASARMVLTHRPELANTAQGATLRKPLSRLGSFLHRLADRLG